MVAYSPSLPRRGIVAASVQLKTPGTKLVPTADWQADAWQMYDVTGQGRYVANAVANAISRCGLYIARLDPDTGEEVGAADDAKLRPLVASPLGTGPRRRENLRLCGLNLFVAGEFYLIGEAPREATKDTPGRPHDTWYVVSGFDFDRRGKGLRCTRPQMAGGGTAVLDVKRDVINRVWTPHPKHANEADSPFRAALPDLAILSTIRKRESAELDSRLTGAGIMAWPQSVNFGKYKTPEEFAERLIADASEIISDPAHPNSLIPHMVTMKAEDISAIRVINFWSELSDALAELTDRKVRSLAQSLDAPIEMTLGTTGDTNHWTAWLVSEDTITTHYEPLLSRIADALTDVYLRPGAEKLGLNPHEYAYAFDTAALRVRGDRLGDDLNLYDRDLISADTVRATAGHTDDDAPDRDEVARKLAQKLILANPALLGTDLARLAGLAPVNDPVIIDSATGSEPDPDDPSGPDDAPRDQIGPPDQSDADPPAAGDRPAITAARDTTDALAAVANEAVTNALRVAGGRLAKTWPAGADRGTLHTTLKRTPERNQITDALRGAWESLPESLAALDVDTGHITTILDRYTAELLRRRAHHNPAALSSLLAITTSPADQAWLSQTLGEDAPS